MLRSYLQYTIFLVLISFSFLQSNSKVEFTIEKLDDTSFKCKDYTYEFEMKGTFNGSPSAFNQFEINLETSDGRKIKPTCTPINILGVTKISCKIDNCLYPLNKENIIFPTTAPQTDTIIFKDWEKVIGKQPGVSNRISNVECFTTKSSNKFIPSSITVEDCLLGISSFIIKGDWENKDKAITNVYVNIIKILLDNENKDVAECYYFGNENPIEFRCNFEGYGRIKFNEQFFKGNLDAYKINGFDSGKSIKCGKDDAIIRIDSGSFNFLNKILIILGFLLF